MGVTLMEQSQHKPKTKPFYLLSRLGRHIQVVPGKEKKKRWICVQKSPCESLPYSPELEEWPEAAVPREII